MVIILKNKIVRINKKYGSYKKYLYIKYTYFNMYYNIMYIQ